MDEEKNTAAQGKFLEIQTLFRRMSSEMCLVVESYYIWRTLTFSRSIPEVGQEEADKNAKLMSKCTEFFLPTEQSHLQTFVVGLMKFFDKKPPALSFISLIEEISKNKDLLTVKTFRDAQPKLHEMGFIKDDYVPINQAIIDEFELFIKRHEVLIGSLKDARDKQFAHTDMKTIKVNFIPNEVENLIVEVQEMFNKLSGCFDQSSTVWDHLKDSSINSTKFLLNSFRRGEDQRAEEIKKMGGLF